MNANEARSITEISVNSLINEWWDKFKDELFEAIKKNAENGESQLCITIHHPLNHEGLLDNNGQKEKLQKKLSELGYKYNYYSGCYQEDGYDKQIDISW